MPQDDTKHEPDAEGADAGDASEREPANGEQSESGNGNEALIGLRRDAEARNRELQETKERLNKLEAERAANRQPAAPDTEQGDAYWKEVEAFAAKGDPVAKAQLAQREQMGAVMRAMGVKAQLDMIEDPKKREKVRDHFLANQSRLGDVKGALAEVNEEELGKATTEQADKIKKLEEELAKLRGGERADTTAARAAAGGGSPAVNKGKPVKMSGNDYDRKQDELRNSGRNMEAMRMQADYRAGRILVED